MPGRTHTVDHAAVFAASPTPCLLLTPDLVIADVNEAYLRATMRDRDELLHQGVFEAFPDNPDDPGATGTRNLRASLERARETRRPHVMARQRYDIPVPGRSGRRFEPRWWAPVNVPVLGEDGSVALFLHRVEDVTEVQRAEARRAASEQRFRALVEHGTDLIVVVGGDRRLEYVSPSVVRVLGHPPETFAARHWGDLAHPGDRGTAVELLSRARAAAPGESIQSRFRVMTRDGTARWMEARATDHSGETAVAGVVVNLRDVTERHEAEQTLHRQALQDALTGMPNRRWFHDALTQALARAARTGRRVGVVLVDVDNFKRVNDSMGHPAGDQLLVELATRMTRALRPEDTVARLGGDEFVVLAEDLHHEQDAFALAQRLAAAATGHYRLAPGLATRVTLSVGVSTGTAGADPDTLLAHADSALYKAKRGGRDRVEVFDPELRARLVHRLHVEQDLHRALARDELALHWQPIVEARDGGLVGLEALLRWKHPERGLLRPGDFLPVAEEAGLVPSIGLWVLRRGVEQAAAWQDLPVPPRVFVNLAAQQLVAPALPAEIAALAAEHGVAPGRIHLEVSERLLPADVAAIRDHLQVLRDQGFGVALDDFGAGNTSLAWLQQLPIDTLKLDRRFAQTIMEPATRAIVSALVQLAPALGLTSLAEGVETREQLRTLCGLGCDYAQGFHICAPRPAEELAPWLAASQPIPFS